MNTGWLGITYFTIRTLRTVFVQTVPYSTLLYSPPSIACITPRPLQQRKSHQQSSPLHPSRQTTTCPTAAKQNRTFLCCLPGLASLSQNPDVPPDGCLSYIIHSPFGDLCNSCYHAMLPYSLVPLPTEKLLSAQVTHHIICTGEYKQYKQYR